MSFNTLPASSTLKVESYRIAVPDAALEELQTALKVSRIAPPTYENAQEDRRFGLTREWVLQAKERWSNGFDWRMHESRINELPNYKATVVDNDQKSYKIHFVGLFSRKKDAIPLILLHGWPGSFLEFLPILNLLKEKYTAISLPYNVIVPSLPGFGFSDRPPLDKEFGFKDTARIMNHLMVGLGFGAGYAAQGGDLGSKVSRILGCEFEACKAVHHNFTVVFESQLNLAAPFDKSTLSARERKGLERGEKFVQEGRAYAQEHATRPATIGLALSASPISLLSWVGEKFLLWSDDDPSLDTILESLSLYWFTDTISTSFYCYRDPYDSIVNVLQVPYGFSSFPLEIYSSPKEWIKTTGNLVYYREHDKGGHFAALEQPEALLNDVEEFLAQNWGQ